MNRRRFLKGLGGAMVALPWLETFAGRNAAHAAGDVPPFLVIMRQANGVQQAIGDEPENFWPLSLGAITAATLGNRAVSELTAHANKLLIVRNVRYANTVNSGCEHSTGGNICLTATDPTNGGNRSLATGESIDNRIARELTPGVEPLTLYAGPKEGYIDEVLSYRGAQQLRAAEPNPYNAYQRLFGTAPTPPNDPNAQRLALARKSVNDLVRDQLKALLGRTDLSTADRQRLDLHFSSIRDVEIAISCQLPTADVSAMQAISSGVRTNANRDKVAKMQIDIIALAMACGVTRVATLQVGDGNDGSTLTLNGTTLPRYHQISHRIFGDGNDGAAIPNAVALHHQVDRWHGQLFKYLLDKLSAYNLAKGTLLDSGLAVWLNDLATGQHTKSNLPYVLAGSAGGFLKQGVYVDAGDVTHNKMLNTFGAAMGVKNAAGAPLDDFGKAGLPKGLITQMLA
ncbi:MAG: DUF1552 domain-containing protein [Myxococcaceae bacterium]